MHLPWASECVLVLVLAATARAAPPGGERKVIDTLVKNRDVSGLLALARRGGEADIKALHAGLRRGRRVASLCAWAIWHHPDASAAPLLRDLLADKDQVCGYWAARALGRIGDREAVAALSRRLPQKENYFWEQSRGGRGWIQRGNQPSSYAPPDMPNIRVAYAAMLALGEIGGPAAEETLTRGLRNQQYLIRHASARGLGTMKARGQLARLVAVGRYDPVLIVREAARTAAAKIRGTWRPPDETPPTMPQALLLIQTPNRTESNLGFRDSYFFAKTPWYAWGENLFVLSPVRPDGKLRNLTNLKGGAVQGPEISHDGRKVLFGMRRNFKADGFHIFEIGVDGRGLRQLTRGNCNDVDPCYLPDGRIIFCSDRAGYREYYHQERSRVLYVMEADGTGIRQVTFNPNQDYEPLVLADGGVVYSSYRFYAQDGSGGPLPSDRFMQRIETVMRTIRPDGSNDQLFYGAMRGSYYTPLRPTPDSLQYSGWHSRGHHIGVAVGQAREMPDGKIVCTTPAGLTLVDPSLPPTDCEWPIYPEVLNLAGGEEVYIHNHDDMNPVGRFTCPHPAGGQWVFVSHAPWYDLRPNGYGIYCFDLATRRKVLVYDDPQLSEIDPIPIVARRRPPVPATQLSAQPNRPGGVYCASVFNSDLPFDRKAVRHVRVIAALYQGLSINANASFRTRILGTVPVAKDGSFYVEVPSNTPFRFQLLDADGGVLVHETAFNYVRPGETKGCIGCHEPKDVMTPNTPPAAIHRRPGRAVPRRGDLIYQGRPSRSYNLIVRD